MERREDSITIVDRNPLGKKELPKKKERNKKQSIRIVAKRQAREGKAADKEPLQASPTPK